MIKFKIEKRCLDGLIQFSSLMDRSIDTFIVNSIKVHLCEWKIDRELFNHGRGVESGKYDRELTIELSDDLMDELSEFSDYHNKTVEDAIQGMVENVIAFMESNWHDKNGKNLSNSDKFKELRDVHNNQEGECWNRYFSY